MKRKSKGIYITCAASIIVIILLAVVFSDYVPIPIQGSDIVDSDFNGSCAVKVSIGHFDGTAGSSVEIVKDNGSNMISVLRSGIYEVEEESWVAERKQVSALLEMISSFTIYRLNYIPKLEKPGATYLYLEAQDPEGEAFGNFRIYEKKYLLTDMAVYLIPSSLYEDTVLLLRE